MQYQIKGDTLPVVICQLQTMPISNVAGAIRPYIPTGN